jgi:hypothetical protein
VIFAFIWFLVIDFEWCDLWDWRELLDERGWRLKLSNRRYQLNHSSDSCGICGKVFFREIKKSFNQANQGSDS